MILYILETYTEALLKMEKLEEDFNYTTDYCTTDVKDDEDSNHNLKKKVIKRESLISPVYGLNGELSKYTEFSYDDNSKNDNYFVFIY